MKLLCKIAFKLSTRIAHYNIWKTIGSNALVHEGVPDILGCLVTTKYWRNLLLIDAPADRVQPVLLVAFDIFDFDKVDPNDMVKTV